jgi:hypothetical protein
LELSKGLAAVWKMKEPDALFMEPAAEYVEQSIDVPETRNTLRKNKLKANILYIFMSVILHLRLSKWQRLLAISR